MAVVFFSRAKAFISSALCLLTVRLAGCCHTSRLSSQIQSRSLDHFPWLENCTYCWIWLHPNKRHAWLFIRGVRLSLRPLWQHVCKDASSRSWGSPRRSGSPMAAPNALLALRRLGCPCRHCSPRPFGRPQRTGSSQCFAGFRHVGRHRHCGSPRRLGSLRRLGEKLRGLPW